MKILSKLVEISKGKMVSGITNSPTACSQCMDSRRGQLQTPTSIRAAWMQQACFRHLSKTTLLTTTPRTTQLSVKDQGQVTKGCNRIQSSQYWVIPLSTMRVDLEWHHLKIIRGMWLCTFSHERGSLRGLTWKTRRSRNTLWNSKYALLLPNYLLLIGNQYSRLES